MEIYINDNKIDYQPFFPLTWGNFFQKLLQEDGYIAGNHGIVRIQLDGVDSLHVMTEQTDQMVPENIAEVKISTKDSISITKDGLAKIVKLIDSIKSEISNAADSYREGNIKEASIKIARIMEAFKPMVNFINSVGMSFSMDFDHIMFNSTTSVRQKIETFLETFNELVEAQEKKDYVEVADYLEYQLLEDMSDWNIIVNLLDKEVEAGAANSA
jgi:dimeric dUTPase (all-alpha-NTP-PPase superfamily)